MAKITVNITGDSKVASIAVGAGATAVGSVNAPPSGKVPTDCGRCGAAYQADRTFCRHCGVPYPQGVGANVGSVSISYED